MDLEIALLDVSILTTNHTRYPMSFLLSKSWLMIPARFLLEIVALRFLTQMAVGDSDPVFILVERNYSKRREYKSHNYLMKKGG